MIKASAFLAIEASLTDRLSKALSLITKELYAKVDEALASGDTDKAMQELNTLQLSSLAVDTQKYVEYMTSIAMLFGASRVTQSPGTSVVGMGFEKMTILQMAGSFSQMITQKAEAYLKQAGAARILQQVSVQKAEPKARILQPFASFMTKTGGSFINIASSLHTSRASAYGFTAEAMALGLTEYQINEQLDNRICPVCREMHGKKFSVADARRALDVVTRVTDPDDLKALQPWPSQSPDHLETMRGMSSEDLVNNNWHIPPFHPRCRGLLARVGKVPTLQQVVTGTAPEPLYAASKEDFDALDVPVSSQKLKLWNQNVGLAPAEVLARLQGVPPDEFLVDVMASDKPKEVAGLTSLNIQKNITMRLTTKGFGAEEDFSQVLKVIPARRALSLEGLTLNEKTPAADAGVAKGYMVELYMLAKDMGLKKIELSAGAGSGGFAWAKYGFQPDAPAWDALKSSVMLRKGTAGIMEKMSEKQRQFFASLIDSPDPATIYALADFPFGKELLQGLAWPGELGLADEEAVTRFLTYLGEI